MTKIAIYTANIGKYDLLRQPYVPEEYRGMFDFICFTNNINRSHWGVWEIRKIDVQINDNTRIARYIKLHPHIFLANYSSTIWIDSNIEVVGNALYEKGRALTYHKVLISSLKHPFWNCAYKDAYFCVRKNKDSFGLIKQHVKFLNSEGYPEDNGLYETQILFRNNQSEIVKTINEEWWDIMCKFSRRDQLSINYLLWKNRLTPNYFLENLSARDHPDFVYHRHLSDFSLSFRSVLKIKLLKLFNIVKGRVLAKFLHK